jgi:flagellar biogenesis protein FliO
MAYAVRLGVVAVMLAALYVIARKLRGMKLFARAGRCLELLESVMISQHVALHVVRVGARYFLIGTSTERVSRLAELAESELTR